ncbi:hypothetical protein [Bradyrhizobium sp. SZCCHNS1012]|uniref:hypothetical protein n=1 Tax=Bradyrhizobium sp. SZCCHNS1012 TaxID=3057297 RepID=UPI0029166FE7|nr:hypothetical protein [Bradyrhizobium sp. SZCCHNS1012]
MSGKKRTPQVIYEWTGEVMRPLAYHKELAAREFEPGKRYKLIEFNERSEVTHDHFFATVTAYWQHWPENYERELPSADHLRKHALIRTGHYIQTVMAHPSVQAATFYVSQFKQYVDYAEGSIVAGANGVATVMRIAKTQKKNVMEAEEFQKSKQDVLEFCASVTGVAPEDMKREAKKERAA